MSNNIKEFSWIPFYTELAKALLRYKEDRKPLVDWIYAELAKVSDKSLVSYLHMKNGSNVIDIDPFSVFAIFNRHLKLDNKVSMLQMFKEKFSLESEIPDDFNGIPTVNSQRAFFYKWDEHNAESVSILWKLFEEVLLEKDISVTFNQVVNSYVPQHMLTMILYWIAPFRFINLDDRNRAYLNTLGFPDKYPNLTYKEYSNLISDINNRMSNGSIPFSSFPELSHNAWKLCQTERIWMYKHYEDSFAINYIRMGSSANGKLDFNSYKTLKTFRKAYQDIAGNEDIAIPDMYWKLMKEVKVGDIIVVFDSKGRGKSFYHELYGWGRITSDVYYDKDDDNPIHRNVEWHLPLPKDPIKESRTNNTKYFHEVKGIEAANIMNLLGINEKGVSIMDKKTIDSYIQLLRTNKNLILTGAPGTGKTYMAKEMARQILGLDSVDELKNDKRFGFVQFHPSYDYTDFVEGLRPQKDDKGNIGFERKDGVFKEFCKYAVGPFVTLASNATTEKTALEVFKQTCNGIGILSHKYEKEFKVKIEDGKIIALPDSGNSYPVKDEDILRYLKEGTYDKEHQTYPPSIGKYIKENILDKNNDNQSINKFVFVIDEINRGEISKIFGELFFSIDPGYRGIKGAIKTQYQNLIEEGDAFKDGFFVPENVYIIGTMNDIDRSVESMDFAMRRRFAWKEVSAEQSYENMIENDSELSDTTKAEIKQRMFGLNEAIEMTEGLDKSYQIGAAYFRKYLDYKSQPKPFDCLWENHLEGLLSEYLRGNRKADELLKKLHKAYNLTNTDEQSANNNEGQL